MAAASMGPWWLGLAVWVVIEDSRWLVGFTAPLAWVPALVAGCASDPASVEDLLVAADFYRRGLAADVTDRLVAADRVRLGRRAPDEQSASVAEQRAGGEHPRPTVAAGEGQLTIALPRRYLGAQGRVGGLVRQRGELEVSEGDQGAGRYVTYQLPGHWTVRIAREAPW